MRRLYRSAFVAVLALLVTVASVFAGAVHITGSTGFSLGSLKVTGTAVGLKSAGITWAKVRYVGYGYCYTSAGAYWTPTDPDQMVNDPNLADDYPEIIQDYLNPANKIEFSLELANPPVSQPNSGCAPGTWVWTGATLQVWQDLGAGIGQLLPGRLLDQQNYRCYPKGNGSFWCK